MLTHRVFFSVADRGSQEWTRELGYKVIKDWRPWLATLDGSDDPESAQRAGYAIDYGNSTGFKYVTVQGAGHSEWQ
eukprot:COSAG06_NODE_243_length_19221_cov_15.057578_12_plen_76_part_00